MGQRSRKRRGRATGAGPRPPGADRQAPSPSRAQLRDEQARAALTPLGADERPRALVVAAVLAGALGLANLIAYLVGTKIQGKTPPVTGVLVFSAVMAVAAINLWRRRYWAVLGFQALLALIVVTFSLFLVRAANLEALVLCLAIIGPCGWLFWKLVGAMARIQMPSRRPPS